MTLDHLTLLLASRPEAVTLPLSMLVVFATAAILAELFERLGQILAGVIVGPSVLGWMAPNEFLTALAEPG